MTRLHRLLSLAVALAALPFAPPAAGQLGSLYPFDVEFTSLTPQAVALADFDGDGAVDLALAGSGVNVHRGLGGARWAPGVNAASGFNVVAILATDLDGDGAPDLLTVDDQIDGLSLLRGDGGGGFL